MNEFENIVKKSLEVIKKEGLRSYFRHAIKKIKMNELEIIDDSAYRAKPTSRKIDFKSKPYELWIKKNERTPMKLKSEFLKYQFEKKPLISIIMPVFNPPQQIFKETLTSVKNQVYDNWELCITNGSTNQEIKKIIEFMKNGDNRILVKEIPNKGISGNTNEALSLVNGSYVALLDHDDTLAVNSLFEVAKAIDQNNSVDLIYSDSDKISEQGQRYEPFFKPDWSPEMMLSVNYIAHFCVMRKKILDEVGDFSTSMDGAQDWDILLRVSEKSKNVVHIPKILYHWRVISESTASSIKRKSYALNSQIMAVTNHLKRRGIDAYIIHDKSYYLRCKIQTEFPKISIIIPISNIDENIERKLNNIIKNTSYPDYEIILVGNNDICKFISERTELKNIVKIYPSSKNNLGEKFNDAVSISSGTLLVFFNINLEPKKDDWLKEMAIWCTIEDVGCIGSKIVDKNNKILHAGLIIDSKGGFNYVFDGIRDDLELWTIFGAYEWYRNYNAVIGDCFMIRKKTFLSMKGFEGTQKNFDIDFCLKLRSQGYRVMYTPYSVLIANSKIKDLKQVNLKKFPAFVRNSYLSPHVCDDDVEKIKI